MCGLVVESGEPRETMHVALLLGYGAAAVCPYLALETRAALHAAGEPARTLAEAQQRYVKAVGNGLLKVCSKMGISTVQCYRGAQIFEAVGLGPRLIDRYFPGTVSRVGGIELERDRSGRRRAATRARLRAADGELDAGGAYRFRVGGVHHVWNPDDDRGVAAGAPATAAAAAFERFCRGRRRASARLATLRSLLEPCGRPASRCRSTRSSRRPRSCGASRPAR